MTEDGLVMLNFAGNKKIVAVIAINKQEMVFEQINKY